MLRGHRTDKVPNNNVRERRRATYNSVHIHALSQPIVSAELNSIRDGNSAVQFDSQNSREEVEMALIVRNQSIRSDGREPVSS